MEKKNTRSKGIYIIPNMLTLGNLFCGFLSIISSLDGKFEMAAYYIILAAFFDGMDGRVARMTNSHSKFGVEFDSLADLASFGMAPALLIYLFALRAYGKLGWMVAFLFVAGGALRLARFNVLVDKAEKNFFTGLPIPSAATVVISYILIAIHYNWTDNWPGYKIILPIMMILISFLMVSNLRYFGFKELDLKKKKPFNLLVIAIIGIYIIVLNPQMLLFILSLLYLISGILSPLLFPLTGKEKVLKESAEQKNVIKAVK
ncbi:MAG: CDP-diacylglycerol--serine O-phosphatidyltransferase [bacterium]|nr:CDP-diacylglycerol--serine O-phosphatidyltransferase [bacterium]